MKTVTEINYDKIGIFKSRPNRYLAEVEIDGNIELAHVHDPGRLKELLYEGAKVMVKWAAKEGRKTNWDLIASIEGSEQVLVNSMYHRYISESIVRDENMNPFGKMDNIRAEVKHGNSRFDFYGEINSKKVWIEVKGCTLVEGRVAKFPDAPTERGRKHLEELTKIAESGEKTAVYILVLREADEFVPNRDTDPKFYNAFYNAVEKGVEIFPIQLKFKDNKITYRGIIPIRKNILK